MNKPLIAALLLAMSSTWVLAADQPVAEAVKINRPPQLDGKLDEPFWQTAKPLDGFYISDKADQGRRVNDTEVRLAYDDTWLYLGVKCDNPLQKFVLEPRVKAHDSAVHEDESIELFFDPTGSGKVYYHFLLSCFNVKAEQRFVNGQQERVTWNLPWRSATAIDARGWSAELAIPLYMFLEYGDLGTIRLNVARNRRVPNVDACNVITHENRESSAWRPVVKSFHEAESFGTLAPMAPGKLKMPFLAGLERVEVKSYFTKDGGNYYAVEVEVRGVNTQSGAVEVVVTDQPVAGEVRVVRQSFGQAGNAVSKRTIEMPAPSPSERKITVELKDAGRGEILQTRIIDNPVVLKVIDAYLDRNYYTTEKEAVAVAEIALPAETIKGMKIAIEVGGKTVASAPAASETRVSFPLKDIPVGTCHVVIALKRSDGAPFGAIPAELVKREPKAGQEVQIDQINRVVLKDSEPFFPFGPVMYGVKAENEADFKEIADAGCNTFFQWNHTIKQNGGAYLPVAGKYGLQLVTLLETGWPSLKEANLKTPGQLLSAPEAGKINSDNRGSELTIRGHLVGFNAAPQAKAAVYAEYIGKCLPVTEQIIKAVKDADNFLAYNSFDEPYDNSRLNTTKCLDDIHRLTQRVDGYHPVMLNYSSHIPEGDEYVTCCDILCTDPYWVTGGDGSWGVRNSPDFVSKIVVLTDRRAAKFRKAVWIIPLGWVWGGSSKRGISGPEQDCQNFLAIIHGAKGLFWFCYPMPSVPWENLKASMAMIKVIGPMAVQPKVRQAIAHLRATGPSLEYKESPFLPEQDEFPDIQGRIFRDPKGGLVLLAANSKYFPVTAKFTVAGLAGKAENIFGKSSLPVKDGVFTEALEPFAVRAYWLGDALKEPVQVTIASLRPAAVPPPETSWPNGARVGKRNVFPNPSFEEETVAGVADYCFSHGKAMIEREKGMAKFGDKCLKMVNDRDKDGGWKSIIYTYWGCAPKHMKETSYVWSFWAKGEKGGEEIEALYADAPKRLKVILTPEWKRYELPLVIPALASIRDKFTIRLMPGGVAWLDGFQLEQGDAATAFEE